MRLLHLTCLQNVFVTLVALGILGCTDQDARTSAQKAMEEIQRLQVRLQANEDLLNRIYKVTVANGVGDQVARDLAQQALDAAKGAQSCCDVNTERLDRLYQKIMSR